MPLPGFPRSVGIIYIPSSPEELEQKRLFVVRVTHETVREQNEHLFSSPLLSYSSAPLAILWAAAQLNPDF